MMASFYDYKFFFVTRIPNHRDENEHQWSDPYYKLMDIKMIVQLQAFLLISNCS